MGEIEQLKRLIGFLQFYCHFYCCTQQKIPGHDACLPLYKTQMPGNTLVERSETTEYRKNTKKPVLLSAAKHLQRTWSGTGYLYEMNKLRVFLDVSGGYKNKVFSKN